jgi:pimeloyl-ACP methyl ester carboxylesterase
MHVETAGHGDPPLLLVHGLGCDSSDWQAQVDGLKSSSTLVTFDLRGHGATPGESRECSIERYGADVAELLADLNMPPAVLVGHSMGCRVILQTYLAAPHRVAGIVLLDGSCIATGDRRAAEQGMAGQIDELGYNEFIQAFFERMFVARSDPELKARILERSQKLPAAIGTALLVNLAGWDAARLGNALKAVRVPLMAIQSTTLSTDRVRVSLPAGQTSPWLDLLRAHVPAVRIEILLSRGHFPQIEAPDDVNSLLTEFVRGLY